MFNITSDKSIFGKKMVLLCGTFGSLGSILDLVHIKYKSVLGWEVRCIRPDHICSEGSLISEI